MSEQAQDKMSNTVVAGFIGFCVGFGVASMTMTSEEFMMTGFVIVIVMAVMVRGARVALMQHELESDQLAQAERKEQLQLLKEETALVKAKARTSRLSTKQTVNYAFTSNDFDDAATHMLMAPVKAARKANAKVTGQGLVETFLKGLR